MSNDENKWFERLIKGSDGVESVLDNNKISNGNILISHNVNEGKIFKKFDSVYELSGYISLNSQNTHMLKMGCGLEISEIIMKGMHKKPYFELRFKKDANDEFVEKYMNLFRSYVKNQLKLEKSGISNEDTIDETNIIICCLKSENYSSYYIIYDSYYFNDDNSNKILAEQMGNLINGLMCINENIIMLNIYEDCYENLLLSCTRDNINYVYSNDFIMYIDGDISQEKDDLVWSIGINKMLITNTPYCQKLVKIEPLSNECSMENCLDILAKKMGYNCRNDKNFNISGKKNRNLISLCVGDNYKCICSPSSPHRLKKYYLHSNKDEVMYKCDDCNSSIRIGNLNDIDNIKIEYNEKNFSNFDLDEVFEFLIENTKTTIIDGRKIKFASERSNPKTENSKKSNTILPNSKMLESPILNYKNDIINIKKLSDYIDMYNDDEYPGPKLEDLELNKNNYQEFLTLKNNKDEKNSINEVPQPNFKVKIENLTRIELILHRARVRTDEIIEMLCLASYPIAEYYDDHRIHLNTLAIKYGYKAYYNIDAREYDKYDNYLKDCNCNMNDLKRFPSSTYDESGENIYMVSDLSKLCRYITPRYIMKRQHFKGSETRSRGICGGNPGNWSFKTQKIDTEPEKQIEVSSEKVKSKTVKSEKATKNKKENLMDSKSIDEVFLSLPEAEINGIFSVNNMRVHLTYKGYIESKDYLETMSKKLNRKIMLYSIVNEDGAKRKGDLFPYEHTHVLMMFDKSYSSTSSRCFDYYSESFPKIKDENGKLVATHPHIRKVVKNSHFDFLANIYHKKSNISYTNIRENTCEQAITRDVFMENTETDDLFDACVARNKNTSCHFGSLKRTQDILIKGKFNDGQKSAKLGVVCEELRKWQKFITHLLNVKNDRAFLYVVGYKGAEGKSKLIAHIIATSNAITIDPMNARDIANLIYKKCLERGKMPETIIVNIPKVKDYGIAKSMTSILESLKDRVVDSGKYEGNTLAFNESPNVIVFTNANPEINDLSLCRWLIYIINEEEITHGFAGEYGKNLHKTFISGQNRLEQISKSQGREFENVCSGVEIPLYPIHSIHQGDNMFKIKNYLNKNKKLCKIIYSDRILTDEEVIKGKIKHLTFLGLRTKYLNNYTSNVVLFNTQLSEGLYFERPILKIEEETNFVCELDFEYRDMTAEEVEQYNNLNKIREEKKDKHTKIHFTDIRENYVRSECVKLKLKYIPSEEE
jgi:hypothetical protein